MNEQKRPMPTPDSLSHPSLSLARSQSNAEQEAASRQTVYLSFHDVINPQTTNRFIGACNDILNRQLATDIYVLFSSAGGAVECGVTLYNYLRALPIPLTMHNIGSVDSIATAVFMAGQRRFAASASCFLFHGINWTFQAPTSTTYFQLTEICNRVGALSQVVQRIITKNSKLTEAELLHLFVKGKTETPDFALAKGIIHEIREVGLPPTPLIFNISEGKA
jgi:ATP-dependent Clp protease protease subunit